MLAFDPATERTRFQARQGLLTRQATLRLELAEGIRFQPETAESVEDHLKVELSDGSLLAPSVDRGTAGPGDRLPSVLALRYVIPDGGAIAALVSNHAEAPGCWVAPAAWSTWTL